MKRRIAKILVAGLIGLQLIGCSNQNAESTESIETAESAENKGNVLDAKKENSTIYFKDIDVESTVTLGEYLGIEVVNNAVAVSDEEVQAYIDYLMSTYNELEEITDRDVVENGDVANIDYEGKKDGVAFAGGTAADYDLAIGSGSFIPGFEEGLVGVKKGETVDLNLTFPTEYHSEELAGAEVVFTVTVNGIYKEVAAELNDEFVVGLGIEGVTTVDEYRAYLKDMMSESYASQTELDMEAQILNQVTESSTVTEVPQELVDKFYEINLSNMTYQASIYGMDMESFAQTYFGLDQAAFEAETMAAAEISAKQAMICLKIAAKENIAVTDEELAAAIEERYAEYGYASAQAFEAAIDKEEYRDSLLLDEILDFLVENAKIAEVPEITP